MNSSVPAPNTRLVPVQAAKYLGVSASYLSQQRRNPNGTGPVFFQIGRKIEYGIADLDAWLAGRRRTVTARRFGSSTQHPAQAQSPQRATA
jgi:hypothetical protein